MLVLIIGISLSLSVSAAMSCSIKAKNSCIGNEKNILTISDLNDGGSHAGLAQEPTLTKAICCSGVPSLETTKYESTAPYQASDGEQDAHEPRGIESAARRNGYKRNLDHIGARSVSPWQKN